MLPTSGKERRIARTALTAPDSNEQTSHMPSALPREQRVPAGRDSDADDQALRPFSAHFTRPCSPLLEDGPPQLRRGGQMARITETC